MRLFYTLCFYLAVPLLLLRLLWRAKAAPAYAKRWAERFGFFKPRASNKPAIWVHAVSVGETLAALPMIKQLQKTYPNYELVVSTMTPTGSERVKASLGNTVFHVYAPYDLPDCVARFMRRIRPELLIIMETELWPNTIRACQARHVPVVLANARLSEKSARGYERFAGLSQQMLTGITHIAAQTQDDAQRLINIGAMTDKVSVTGNIKFDIQITSEDENTAQRYRGRWQSGGNRPVLLAASTHEGEDELLLQAHDLLLQKIPNALLVLVPRHPERFTRVAELASKSMRVQRHSSGELVAQETQVLIGDSMGEMMALLGACDICFMGGSWVTSGGHNLIEPAVWGKPLFSGPSLFNFSEVSALLLAAHGLLIVETPAELAVQVEGLLKSEQALNAMGADARRVAEQNKGALERLLDIIESVLKPQV